MDWTHTLMLAKVEDLVVTVCTRGGARFEGVVVAVNKKVVRLRQLWAPRDVLVAQNSIEAVIVGPPRAKKEALQARIEEDMRNLLLAREDE